MFSMFYKNFFSFHVFCLVFLLNSFNISITAILNSLDAASLSGSILHLLLLPRFFSLICGLYIFLNVFLHFYIFLPDIVHIKLMMLPSNREDPSFLSKRRQYVSLATN